MEYPRCWVWFRSFFSIPPLLAIICAPDHGIPQVLALVPLILLDRYLHFALSSAHQIMEYPRCWLWFRSFFSIPPLRAIICAPDHGIPQVKKHTDNGLKVLGIRSRVRKNWRALSQKLCRVGDKATTRDRETDGEHLINKCVSRRRETSDYKNCSNIPFRTTELCYTHSVM
ncbi:hypothetical protein J6590_071510 [Homalodisca vitripennis]|nr:hypothetical protein J6590_071510 [Homalodisca vitripennis]